MNRPTYILCTLMDSGISGFLIWSKTLMELIFNPCDEFWWSLEGPVRQIHSPHLYVGAPGIFSDLLRSVLMLRGWVRKTTGSYHTYSSLVKLQPWFLSLRWKTCLGQNCSFGSWACSEGPALGQNTLMIMMMDKVYFYFLNYANIYGPKIWYWSYCYYTENCDKMNVNISRNISAVGLIG